MENYYLWNTWSINSIFHFLIPFNIGFILKGGWKKYGIPIVLLFEFIENFSGFTLILWNWEIFSPEPLINIISDIIIGILSLYLGYKFRLRFKDKKKPQSRSKSTKRGK